MKVYDHNGKILVEHDGRYVIVTETALKRSKAIAILARFNILDNETLVYETKTLHKVGDKVLGNDISPVEGMIVRHAVTGDVLVFENDSWWTTGFEDEAFLYTDNTYEIIYLID